MNTNPDDAREPAIRILDALHEATVVRDDANKRCISLQRVISSALHILDDMRHMEPDLGDRPQDTWRVFFIHAGEVASALKRAWPTELVSFEGSPLTLIDRLIRERDDLNERYDLARGDQERIEELELDLHANLATIDDLRIARRVAKQRIAHLEEVLRRLDPNLVAAAATDPTPA